MAIPLDLSFFLGFPTFHCKSSMGKGLLKGDNALKIEHHSYISFAITRTMLTSFVISIPVAWWEIFSGRAKLTFFKMAKGTYSPCNIFNFNNGATEDANENLVVLLPLIF